MPYNIFLQILSFCTHKTTKKHSSQLFSMTKVQKTTISTTINGINNLHFYFLTNSKREKTEFI